MHEEQPPHLLAAVRSPGGLPSDATGECLDGSRLPTHLVSALVAPGQSARQICLPGLPTCTNDGFVW